MCHEGVCLCACVGGHSRVAKDHHILNIISHTMHSYIVGIQRFPEKETAATIAKIRPYNPYAQTTYSSPKVFTTTADS